MTSGKINEETVKQLPVPNKGNRVTYFAGAMVQGAKAPRGFGVRVTAAGARAFVLNYRLRGREYRFTIGAWPDWSALKAVREARDLRQRIDCGENPLADRVPVPATATVAAVLDEFVARYVRNSRQPLRVGTVKAYESMLARLVKPRIGKFSIYELRRSHIVRMLDEIEDSKGPIAARQTLGCLRKAFNWHALRDDEFRSPIVRGMARVRPKERARTRVLSDDEIRCLWPELTKAGTFGALIKVLLLTAQRRNEVAGMAVGEIGADEIWTIPAERSKTGCVNFVPLSTAALTVIKAQPTSNGYVFPSGVGTPFSGFSRNKAAFDQVVLAAMQKQATGAKIEPIPNWTLHDLRRTAKTLMARAGVRPDISERVLGHALPGIQGTYDRHHYADEKRDALEKLAEVIKRILHPLPANVRSLR
jgi:integrase